MCFIYNSVAISLFKAAKLLLYYLKYNKFTSLPWTIQSGMHQTHVVKSGALYYIYFGIHKTCSKPQENTSIKYIKKSKIKTALNIKIFYLYYSKYNRVQSIFKHKLSNKHILLSACAFIHLFVTFLYQLICKINYISLIMDQLKCQIS